MKLDIVAFCFFNMALVSLPGVQAQGIGDSSFQTLAVKRAVGYYHSSLFPENALYNGNEYIQHKERLQNGHAYFQVDRPLEGSVTYDDILFENVNLMLDLVRDELIIIHPVNKFKIRLVKDKVTSFTIGNHHFIHIKEDSANQSKLAVGFYQLVYNNHTVVVKKLTKSIKEELVTGQGALYHIIEKSAYFLEKDNRFYNIRNKRDLFNSLRDKKKELNAYYKKQHLDIGAEKEKAILDIAAYYDELQD